ncbi:CBS-domain-containing protein [Hanseniaspora valbyensis NRRL Y-1626]|uniref:CBS-domain-containing protein n=1 Tax=Hanseniaspora valbyensis NRRL Y-1626 TaxID=766949 RepID=A0A1B7TF97_9ASCO|nr:CBS-domain-containing protein [Hanseniaspora valbyensis NRRL Y-1626]
MSISVAQNINLEQELSLQSICKFLKARTSYDVLPVSYKLIVLDTKLTMKRALTILNNNNIVSAPLWDAENGKFAGLLTLTDFINCIQYQINMSKNNNASTENVIDMLALKDLHKLEMDVNFVYKMDDVNIHPFQTLFQACLEMNKSNARRISLIDFDEDTGKHIVISVLTQYRILKFLTLNCREIRFLKKNVQELGIMKPFKDLKYCKIDTPVMEVIELLSSKGVSSIPILEQINDDEFKLINCYEAVDVMGLVKNGLYNDLSLTVGEALLKRNENDFEGVYTCQEGETLFNLLDCIRTNRVHRFYVIDGRGVIKGLITLSDILTYILQQGGAQ